MFGWLDFIFGNKIPALKTLDDFCDERARDLAKKNFKDIGDIPPLYSELEKTDGKIALDAKKIGESLELPKEIKQLIAGAILNYEITKRKKFKIPIENIQIKLNPKSGTAKLTKACVYAIIKREATLDYHEYLADTYVAAAERIYRFQEDNLK